MNAFRRLNLFQKILVGTVAYALVWAFVFGACFAIDKAVGDATTGHILQIVKYAGYPLLGIGWVLGWIIAGIVWIVAQIALGAVWLLKATFPFWLYVLGIPLTGWVLYKVGKHLLTNPGPSQAEQEADARHAESMRVVRGAMLYRSLSDMTKK